MAAVIQDAEKTRRPGPSFPEFDDFVIEREIGRGGMGVVYLARQLSLARTVALKVLPREYLCDRDRVGRFKREAESASRLDHPCIVPVYGVGEQGGFHYIVMKYVEGQALDSLIAARRRALYAAGVDDGLPTQTLRCDSADVAAGPAEREPRAVRPSVRDVARSTKRGFPATSDPGWVYRCLRIAEKIARALEHAHERGVIHRDVKPGNIIIDQQGEPFLLDFGLVRDLSAHSLTESNGILGTAYYLSPETVTGDKAHIDHRVDVYALAVTLYEMVALYRPFDYQSPDTLFHCIVNEEPVPPRKVNPFLPKDLDTVILKAMEKDPARRYSSAHDLAEDLARVRKFESVVARPVSPVQRVKKWVSRNPAIAAATLFSLLSFVGMVEYTIYRGLLDERRVDAALMEARQADADGNAHGALQKYRLYRALGGADHATLERLAVLEATTPAVAPGERR